MIEEILIRDSELFLFLNNLGNRNFDYLGQILAVMGIIIIAGFGIDINIIANTTIVGT